MANKKRGEVAVEIGGESRVLKLDFNALCMLEEISGKPATEVFAEKNVGLKTIRDALYVGLVHRERRLTREAVGRWVQDAIDSDSAALERLGTAIAEAVTAALGVEQTKGESGGPFEATPPASTSTS